jgi:ABC-type sugar transport system ATPase subunit
VGIRSDPPHLALRGLRKAFGDVVAIEGLDLEVQRGEFLVVLGPSGCGKTTILRMIAGLTGPTAGEVEMDGRSITRLPPGKRDVAMVFQGFALLPHLTVAGNLAFEIGRLRLGRAASDARILEAARALGIEDLLERFPGELSSGQKQRVALGRAMAREPRLLLLDEPLSSLDAVLRREVRSEILRLHRLRHTTTIHVTHDPVDALVLATRVAVLRAGRLEQVGAPDEVVRSPRTTFVAGFLGDPPMSLVRGSIREEGGRTFLDLAGASLEVFPGRGPSALSRGEVIAGIRPDGIRVVAAGAGRIHGEIESVERAGREAVVHVLPRGERTSAPVRVLAAPDPGLRAGALVDLDLDPHAVQLFDARTGEALGSVPGTATPLAD